MTLVAEMDPARAAAGATPERRPQRAMYSQFYGLRESPFALTPDPRYLFLSEPHKEALASAVYGLQERKGFVLILGEVGTGKTTLIRHLLGRFGPDIRTVFVFNPNVSFLELMQLILRDLELSCPSLRRVEMIDTLNEYLLKEAWAGRYVVLIVDEAQHLSPAVLEEVRMLSNLETARGKLIQIVLVGQPELGEKLGRPELRQLRQRIGLVAELKPLSYGDTVKYVAHRLDVAGHTGQPIFTRRALKIIHRASGGIPRLINVLCDKSLVLGYGAGTREVGGRIVKEVLKDWAAFRRRRRTGLAARARSRRMARRRAVAWGPFGRVPAIMLLGVLWTALVLGLAGHWDAKRLSDFWRGLTAGAPRAATVAGERQVPAAELPPRNVLPAAGISVPDDPPKKSEGRALGPGRTAILPARPASPKASPLSLAPDQKREIVVRPGDAFSALLVESYGRADLTLLDFVKAVNPDITDIDRLRVGQRLKLPSFEPRALVEQTDGSQYRLHLLTVWDTGSPAYQKVRAALEKAGRQVYVVPLSLTRTDTAYRVLVGDFADRREAEAFYRTFGVALGDSSQLWR